MGLCAFTAEGPGSIPGQGTKIPQTAQCGQKTKQNKKVCKMKGGIIMSFINTDSVVRLPECEP